MKHNMDNNSNTQFSAMFPRNEADQRISELSKLATQHSYTDDWDKAIQCLEKIWLLIPDALMDHGAKCMIRLPIFLQRAGRFDEAEQKFNELLLMADEYASRVCRAHNLKELCELASKHHFLSEVYNSMGAAYKREKLSTEALNYKTLSDKHFVLGREYSDQLINTRRKMLDEYKKMKEIRNEELEKKKNFKWTPKF